MFEKLEKNFISFDKTLLYVRKIIKYLELLIFV